MKKYLAPLFSLLFFFYLIAPAYAVDVKTCPSESDNFKGLCSFTSDNIPTFISSSITLLLIVAVLGSVFFLILGGIKWIASSGDKTKVETAQKQIVAAVIGLVIAFLAFFIISVVGHIFGVDNITNFTIPQFIPGTSSSSSNSIRSSDCARCKIYSQRTGGNGSDCGNVCEN